MERSEALGRLSKRCWKKGVWEGTEGGGDLVAKQQASLPSGR